MPLSWRKIQKLAQPETPFVAHDITALDASKFSIAEELYIATADDNYVVARWSFIEGFDLDFLWLAVHALEKYLKATLLLNGRCAKDQRHDIVKLYAQVLAFASDLLPSDLPKPQCLEVDFWFVETVEQFIARLYRNGRAENC
jgi:hypothetical protein